MDPLPVDPLLVDPLPVDSLLVDSLPPDPLRVSSLLSVVSLATSRLSCEEPFFLEAETSEDWLELDFSLFRLGVALEETDDATGFLAGVESEGFKGIFDVSNYCEH